MSQKALPNRYERQIEEIQQEIVALQKSRRIVTTPQELESLEREIRELTERLGNALLGEKMQASLDSDEMSEAEQELVKQHPKRLKSEGKKTSRCAPHLARKSS
jgi:hypothetical protein